MSMTHNMIAQWRERTTSPRVDNQMGTILSWTKVCVAPEPFEGQVPYFLAVIAVEDGTSILCPIADANESELAIGCRVRFVTRIINQQETNSIITYGIKAVIK